MAATSFAFNAILKFSGRQAESAIGRVNSRFRSLNQGAKRVSVAVSRAGQASRALAFGLLPVAFATLKATKDAANFEAQMSTVQSVLLATRKEMLPLNDLTKKLGATTVFSAREAATGAEFLARAGFNINQTIGALPGVLNAAAASGIGLADASRIVASTIKAFSLPAREAANVADSLNLVTARTNSTFLEMGEAMKLASAATAPLGFTAAETAAAIGLIANSGLRGSRAGTALANALNKLLKPSKETLDTFGGPQGINMLLTGTADASKKLLPLPVIFTNISQEINAMSKNTIDAARIANEFFKVRGARAFAAFDAQASKSLLITTENIDRLRLGASRLGRTIALDIGKSIPFITALELEAQGATGIAERMAKIRLDNLTGAFTILTSAVEGLNIEVGGVFQLSLKNLAQSSVQFLGVVIRGFQLAKTKTFDVDQEMKSLGGRFSGLLPAAIEFAKGFIDGFNDVRIAAKEIFKEITILIKPFFDATGLTTREVGKLVAKFIIIGTIATPILAALGIALFIIPPIVGTIVTIVGGLISTMFSLGSIAIAVGGFLLKTFLFITGPIGGIITLVLLFVDALQALIRPGDFIENLFSVKLFRAVGNFFDMALNKLKAFTSKFSILGKFFAPLQRLFRLSFDAEALKKEDIGTIERFIPGINFKGPIKRQSVPPPAEREVFRSEQAKRGIIESKSIVAPPSEQAFARFREEIAQIDRRNASSNEPKVQRLTGELRAKIEGRDLMITLQNAKLDQATFEGRDVDPRDEGRQRRNGSSF